MSHAFSTVIADLAILFILVFLPVMWILFTDRFRHNPDPHQFVSLLAVAALGGILMRVAAISVIAVTGLLGLAMAWLSARFALSGVSYQRTLSPARLFPGEEADLVLRLDNRKLLPLAWVVITDPLQVTVVRSTYALNNLIRFSGGIELLEHDQHALVNRAAVSPYQVLVRTYRVKGLQRGAYFLGPAQVESGDPFGIFRREATLAKRMEILVYPSVFDPDEIGLPFREALGEMMARRALFDDPTLLAGSREFQPGDPLHRMHWKATARTGALQVRLNDPSTTAQVMIVLNLNTYQHVWQGVDPERMEAAINVAASLAVWAREKEFAVGLRSNGIVAGAENTPRIAPSASPRQATYILEHLARLAWSGPFPPEIVLLDEARRLEAGSSIVFVTPTITPQLISVLTSRQLSGRVSVIYCGRFAAPVIRGLPIYLVVPPREMDRAVS